MLKERERRNEHKSPFKYLCLGWLGMDKTQVVIIGAGPSGLALGLALAKLQIRVGISSYMSWSAQF